MAVASAAVLAVAATTGSLSSGTPTGAESNAGAESGVVQLALTPERAQAAPPQEAAPKEAAPKAPAEKTLSYDFQYQPNAYYCGPASTRIALSAQGHTPSQDNLAGQLGTTFAGTNSSHDIARVLNKVVGGDAYRVREIPGQKATSAQMDRLQADVVEAVGKGRPVVANIVGGATDNDGFWRSFPGGHYVTIVGYGDEGRQVRVADPSGVGPASYWMSTITMAHWMASRGYSY
ncbi:C39 family peptidase [Polymorphospora sp. NPDC051019]|uniref:C39 family peptidase n=1 Tax=Polymorphospora sp. NPDC051019 TaxID=3155725 RepID=UPI00341E97F6